MRISYKKKPLCDCFTTTKYKTTSIIPSNPDMHEFFDTEIETIKINYYLVIGVVTLYSLAFCGAISLILLLF